MASIKFPVVFSGKNAVLEVSPSSVAWRNDQRLLGSAPIDAVAGAVISTATKLNLVTVRLSEGCCVKAERYHRDEPKTTSFLFADQSECVRAETAIRCAAQGVDMNGPVPQRNVLVIINPNSGSRKGPINFTKIVAPIFDAAGIKYTVFATQRAGHAHDLFAGKEEKFNLFDYNGFVCVSGDGLINECLQGLMKRPTAERDRLLQIPMGHVPGGTSNAWAASQRCRDIQAGALLIAHGTTRPTDLLEIKQDGKTHYAFLLVQWAFAAEVNERSEHNRWMGGGRKNFVVLKLIMQLPAFAGKLSYVRPKAAPVRVPCGPGCTICVDTMKKPADAAPAAAAPAPVDSVAVDDVTVGTDAKLLQADSVASAAQSAQFDALHVADDEELVEINSEFLFMSFTKSPDITYDMKLAPFCHHSDGLMELFMIRKGVGRCKLLDGFGKIGNGSHFGVPWIEYAKVKRFQLDPKGNSNINLDGETYPAKPIHVELVPCAWRMYGLPIAQTQADVGAAVADAVEVTTD
eukprot:TRINITY_DN12054_c0_g1_i1.p1 TRINITY_DN12054_c0_g1~~TRINITY_DN12054_c0_g1_i1.p1  ORF type:complete len:525 (+),score=124.36 TRINITY_DN12054_c0_g1_i1:24-1577(+)